MTKEMKYPITIWHQPEQGAYSRFSPSDRPIEYIRKDMFDELLKAFIKQSEDLEQLTLKD